MANIAVPLWPVPITLQTLGVFSIAFFLGSKRGLLAMLAYVGAGISGLGVFAGFKAGPAALIGPTGGYIVGFLACVYLIGWMIENGFGRSKASVAGCMVLGNLIIYASGLAGLKLFLGDIGLWELLLAGVIPFLVGDALKILAAMAVFPHLWRRGETAGS